MSAVNLSSSARTGLSVLRSVADQMEVTQKRLATGKAVNSPIDNVSKFFTAASMDSRASTLDALMDNISSAHTSVKAASEGVKGIQGLIKVARGLATEALGADATKRTALMGQFNTLRTEMAQLADDAGINGTNLLKGNSITVLLNEDGTSKTTIAGTNITDTLVAEAEDWGDAVAADAIAAIGDSIADLDTAEDTLKAAATAFSSSLATINTRKDFNTALSNLLKTGSNDLTAADMDQEAANLMALQTRQQMAATALSIMQSSESTALRLLR
ncbi:MAG: hypothetical protein IR164_10020 [Devosia sp.]|uniref:flagellin n=1 Tax=Devosia sp. TaxID=1871048 RepID=UPI0019E3B34E|nr:hypothetical protein [Devosia sp.]MBF0679262.1 hypothetical protein [Devosia sp.]